MIPEEAAYAYLHIYTFYKENESEPHCPHTSFQSINAYESPQFCALLLTVPWLWAPQSHKHCPMRTHTKSFKHALVANTLYLLSPCLLLMFSLSILPWLFKNIKTAAEWNNPQVAGELPKAALLLHHQLIINKMGHVRNYNTHCRYRIRKMRNIYQDCSCTDFGLDQLTNEELLC